ELRLDWEKNPLIPVVLQNYETRDVLFVASTDREAYDLTRRSGRVFLWSRSRNELWEKGATSGDYLAVRERYINCNQDSLLYMVEPEGKGVCHVKIDGKAMDTCYFRRIEEQDGEESLVMRL
ncbi:phosphoribosyl-AMP cyclohydrolase, partial [Candidatus Woesearchaeota archaeon]|nr:phosphoribosyl-AMP cyclohydrolase [Candidatus Woesearchaeota archaeon]